MRKNYDGLPWLALVLFSVLILTLGSGAIQMLGQQKRSNIKLKATPHSTVLQWTDTSAAANIGYFVYVGNTPGGESATHINPSMVALGTLCTTTALYCTYTDTAVVQGAQKCYTVAASDGTRLSPMSAEVCATTPTDPLAAPVLGTPIVN
jgi:hypothetical protein